MNNPSWLPMKPLFKHCPLSIQRQAKKLQHNRVSVDPQQPAIVGPAQLVTQCVTKWERFIEQAHVRGLEASKPLPNSAVSTFANVESNSFP
jgi:hypothetical protein